MKKIIMIIAVATSFVACKNKTSDNLTTNKNLMQTDTNLLRRSGLLSDTGLKVVNGSVPTTSYTTTTVTTTTTTASGVPPKTVLNSSNTVAKKPATSTKSSNSTSGNTSTAGTSSTPAVKRDKGWSDAAKGTAIGVGSGAILGAIVSKNKVKGAVIGGVVGGAGGYVIGRSRDKKSGRVARNKKQ